jgi:hypothetical protein
MHRFAISASTELSEGLAVVLTDAELNLAARMGLRGCELSEDSCLVLSELTGLSQIESIEPGGHSAELVKEGPARLRRNVRRP